MALQRLGKPDNVGVEGRMDEKQRSYAINQLKRAANEGVGSEEMSWVEISLFGLALDCLDRIEQLEKPKAKTQKIKPDPNCPHCHGNGEVYDIVPYGSTTASLPSWCECVESQTNEDTDEIELDLSE